MTVYCYDTEFIEDGSTIELISIGIVCEDGREYYAINADFSMDRIRSREWLVRNVLPHLPITHRKDLETYLSKAVGTPPNSVSPGVKYVELDKTDARVKPKWVIANEVRDFIVGHITRAGEKDGEPWYWAEELPELWADYGAYDHVALAQLWGPMVKKPDLVPMFTHDLQQLLETLPGFKPPTRTSEAHDALADARHLWEVLVAAKAAGAK